MPPAENAPPVSIVQPLCGVETFSRETLRSIFALDYPDYEIVFCLANARRPDRPAGPRRDRGAPRASRAAAHRRRPRQRQSQAQQRGEGLEGGPPRLGDHRRLQRADAARLHPAAAGPLAPRHRHRLRAADRLAARNRSAPRSNARFLNTYEARWQYAAEAAGLGFAQGKTMLWRRDILEAGGGIEALGARDRRGRRIDQADPRPGLRRPPRQRTVPAAAWRAQAEGRLGAAGALGAAAAGDLSAAFRAGDPDDQSGDDRGGGVSRRRNSG